VKESRDTCERPERTKLKRPSGGRRRVTAGELREQSKSIGDRKRAQRKKQLSNEHFQFIDESTEADRELTSWQLHGMAVKEYPDLSDSFSTIKRARCEH